MFDTVVQANEMGTLSIDDRYLNAMLIVKGIAVTFCFDIKNLWIQDFAGVDCER